MKTKLLLLVIPLFGLLIACGAAAPAPGAGSAGLSQYKPVSGTGVSGGTTTDASGTVANSAAVPFRSGSKTSEAGSAALPLPPLTQIELNANLGLRAGRGKFDETLNKMNAVIAGYGGYMSGSQSGQSAGSFTYEIPSQNFEKAIADLSSLKGLAKRISFDMTSKNHSNEYVDLRARLASARGQLAAYNALLSRASTIGDIVSLEQQIATVQTQIEQLQGQLNYLDSVTKLSTLTVTLTESGAAPPPPAGDAWGFVSAFWLGLHNAAAVLNWIVVAIATVAPLLLVGGILYFVVRRTVWRPALRA